MAAINVDKKCSVSISPQNRRKESLLNDCDINKILERKFGSGNSKLVDWELESLDEQKGYMGQYYYLRVMVQIDGKMQSLQFFAKAPPPNHSPQFQFQQQSDLFNKEITIYMDLIQQIGMGGTPKWMVECYLCKRNVVIVLEDASIDGYATMNKYVPFDEKHCIWLLKTLSRLHSRSLVLDERLRQESGRTIFDLYGQMLNEVLYREGERPEQYNASCLIGVCAIVDLIEELDAKEKIVLKRRITEWSREMSRLLAPSRKHRNVICHRDVWANNIMFRHDLAGNTNGCYLIDWQFLNYCPPAIDFACCLYLTTDRNIRDRHFDFFAKIYHDSFAQGLAEEGLDVNNYLSWTAFQESYIEARNIARVYAVLNLQILLLSSDIIADYFGESVEKLEKTIYGDERTKLVHYHYEKEPAFKLRILEVLYEINDRLPEHPPNL